MKKRTIIISSAAVIVVGLIAYAAVKSKSSPYQFVTVTQGPITEQVDVTGNTTPIQSLDLAFQNGGTISAVYKNAGDNVGAGQALAQLDTSGLQAQLAQEQASVDAAQATLEKLQAGATPQAIQVSQIALTNAYSNVQNTVTAALAQANDAVRNQIAALFSNPESNNPQLTFAISSNQVLNDTDFERVQASQELNNWQVELNALNASSPTSTLNQSLISASNHIAVIEQLLTSVANAVVDAIALPASTSVTYKTDIANAVSEADSAATSVSSAQQAIASAQAALNSTLAGSTSQDIAAQQAAVEQAKANMQSVQVNINEATLVSPINGVVTVQNAKVGQIASPGQTVTSVISGNNFEVDTYVPETDIGKIALNDSVSMAFDAFPGETFAGKVFYIDPAETIESGVVDYLVKVSFNTPDSRIKSGLTANLTIDTQTDANALILPQYAIIQNVSGTFVDILQNNKEVQIPVTIGIQDQNGNAEIASGVAAGEQVINIGLKAQ